MNSEISLKTLKLRHKTLSLERSPLAVYRELYDNQSHSFLYESLESLGQRGRFSFVGGQPFLVFKSRGKQITIQFYGKNYTLTGNPLDELKLLTQGCKTWPSVIPFSGGAVGYMSYDGIRQIEDIPDDNINDIDMPELYFIFPEEIVVFDHKERTAEVILYSRENDFDRFQRLIDAVQQCPENTEFSPVRSEKTNAQFETNFTREAFCTAVEKCKEYILAGDIFQVVLSQRLSFDIKTEPLRVYNAMRLTNPSPYMYYLNFDGNYILGSSPEILVKLDHQEVTIRPVAGTRPRGKTPEEDEVIKAQLLSDEKERAEHIMLLDLSRNDIGQVCESGSVRVTDLFIIEKYSKVMHLVSNVKGRLAKHKDAYDLLKACFPAGTVSGAPKIRAMEIIEELENYRRNVYAGSIGYFGFSGDMDMCIAIRMMLIKKRKGYIQAGAGIVADSVPEKEYEETLNKAKALIRAVQSTGV